MIHIFLEGTGTCFWLVAGLWAPVIPCYPNPVKVLGDKTGCHMFPRLVYPYRLSPAGSPLTALRQSRSQGGATRPSPLQSPELRSPPSAWQAQLSFALQLVRGNHQPLSARAEQMPDSAPQTCQPLAKLSPSFLTFPTWYFPYNYNFFFF